MTKFSTPDEGHALKVYRAKTFRDRPVVPLGGTYSTQSAIEADEIFPLIQQQPPFKHRKVNEKRVIFRTIYHSLKRAAWVPNGCVRYPRRMAQTSRITLQIIECMEQAGLVERVDSRRGGCQQSRLIPTGLGWRDVATDPRQFDPADVKEYVLMFRERKSKDRIAFPAGDPIAVGAQRMLEQINAINSQFNITYQPYGVWDKAFDFERALNPIQCVYYTEDTTKHGRIYTPGRYGHQSLTKIERKTIQFDGEPCVELDFAGYHTRMIYHSIGIDYREDPYALWPITTKAQRYLAKTLLNTAFNAKTKAEAIQSCEHAKLFKTKSGAWKTGKKLAKAKDIRKALTETKLSFGEIWRLLAQRHPQLVPFFGKDMGYTKLMPADGRIAMNVMFDLTQQNIPCLGIHDSFCIPKTHEATLREVMVCQYQKELNTPFPPSITVVNARQATRLAA